MMTPLKEYIEEIRAIRIDNTLSDDAVVALMNIHLCVMTMIVANQLEDEYGSADIHRESIEKLFALCRRRSAGNQSLARCSRMTPAMYNIFSMPDSVFDGRKYDSCLSRTFRMADEWSAVAKEPCDMSPAERETEYGVLLSLSEAFAYVPEPDKSTDRDFAYMRQRIAEWASQTDSEGCWRGLPFSEAVSRLGVMTSFCSMHPHALIVQATAKSAEFYCARMREYANPSGRTLYGLYRVVTGCTSGAAASVAEIVCKMAESQAARNTCGSDEWLWSAAVVIDRGCAGINNEIKQNMRAHSA